MFTVDPTFTNPVSSHDIARTKNHVFTVSCDNDHVSIVPEPLAEHFNVPWESEFHAVAWIVFVQQNHVSGKNWALEKPLEFARVLWDEFSNIPVNDDEEIEFGFLHFDAGSDKNEVWHWFENTFNLSIAKDLH